jgi:hypothetical protein
VTNGRVWHQDELEGQKDRRHEVQKGDLVACNGCWRRVISVGLGGELVLISSDMAVLSEEEKAKKEDPFFRVQPGKCWWWWFLIDGAREVFRVVRDGSGELWVSTYSGGCKLSEFRGTPLEPVKE